MKRLPILFLIATSLVGCSNIVKKPAVNAENKNVVYIYNIEMSYPKKEPDMTLKTINTIAQLKFGLPSVLSEERAEYTPKQIYVLWTGGSSDVVFGSPNYTVIPYSPYLEEALLAGEWVYYNPGAANKAETFVPCPTYCGPAGKPSLAELKYRAKYLTQRANEQDHRAHYEIIMTNRTTDGHEKRLQAGRDLRARKAARAEKLKKELERIEADYKRSNK